MRISIENATLRIDMQGWERIWALKGSIAIPIEHIEGVSTEEPASGWTDPRAPGTFVPGLIRAGTYFTRRGKEFWYATRGKPFLVIETRGERYRRVILTIADSGRWADQVRAEIAGRDRR